MDVSAAGTQQHDVRLLALRDLKNVNAIEEQQRLPFGRQGVTVVYGRNASGKSGYARVLKHACRARDIKETIHPNLFGGASLIAPTAVFELQIDGQEQNVAWELGKPSPDELAYFAVFDARCARIYVDEKNEVAYMPYGMDVFQKLADLCTRFREQMVKERDAINTRPAVLHDFDDETETGRLVTGLSAETPLTRLQDKARLSQGEQQRFNELDEQLKRTEV